VTTKGGTRIPQADRDAITADLSRLAALRPDL